MPAGMIYALKADTVDVGGSPSPNGCVNCVPGKINLRPGKRPRPIVLRMNVGDCLDVPDDVHNRASRPSGRVTVTGAIVGDEADAALVCVPDVRFERLPRGRRAVVEDDRPTGRVTGVVDGERTAVSRGNRQLVHPASVDLPAPR